MPPASLSCLHRPYETDITPCGSPQEEVPSAAKARARAAEHHQSGAAMAEAFSAVFPGAGARGMADVHIADAWAEAKLTSRLLDWYIYLMRGST